MSNSIKRRSWCTLGVLGLATLGAGCSGSDGEGSGAGELPEVVVERPPAPSNGFAQPASLEGLPDFYNSIRMGTVQKQDGTLDTTAVIFNWASLLNSTDGLLSLSPGGVTSELSAQNASSESSKTTSGGGALAVSVPFTATVEATFAMATSQASSTSSSKIFARVSQDQTYAFQVTNGTGIGNDGSPIATRVLTEGFTNALLELGNAAEILKNEIDGVPGATGFTPAEQAFATTLLKFYDTWGTAAVTTVYLSAYSVGSLEAVFDQSAQSSAWNQSFKAAVNIASVGVQAAEEAAQNWKESNGTGTIKADTFGTGNAAFDKIVSDWLAPFKSQAIKDFNADNIQAPEVKLSTPGLPKLPDQPPKPEEEKKAENPLDTFDFSDTKKLENALKAAQAERYVKLGLSNADAVKCVNDPSTEGCPTLTQLTADSQAEAEVPVDTEVNTDDSANSILRSGTLRQNSDYPFGDFFVLSYDTTEYSKLFPKYFSAADSILSEGAQAAMAAVAWGLTRYQAISYVKFLSTLPESVLGDVSQGELLSAANTAMKALLAYMQDIRDKMEAGTLTAESVEKSAENFNDFSGVDDVPQLYVFLQNYGYFSQAPLGYVLRSKDFKLAGGYVSGSASDCASGSFACIQTYKATSNTGDVGKKTYVAAATRVNAVMPFFPVVTDDEEVILATFASGDATGAWAVLDCPPGTSGEAALCYPKSNGKNPALVDLDTESATFGTVPNLKMARAASFTGYKGYFLTHGTGGLSAVGGTNNTFNDARLLPVGFDVLDSRPLAPAMFTQIQIDTLNQALAAAAGLR